MNDRLEAAAIAAGTRAFTDEFDAVLMLTWSHWQTEPRSNRYHYGSRFARRVPVLFIQPTLAPGAAMLVTKTDVPGLDLVEFPQHIGPHQVAELLDLLRARGIRRPLLWVYSVLHYDAVLRALPNDLRVYHATEDYLTPSPQWSEQEFIAGKLRTLLKDMDLVVGVSEKVNRAYAGLGEFEGPLVLAPNGCDAEFFLQLSAGSAAPRARTCIYQGGINARVDFELLASLVDRLPDWTFQFCGRAIDGLAGWDRLRSRPNVQDLGVLEPAEFGRRMCEATVGLIPFVQDPLIWNSLPLKAYEYVACGLPVVSVPIASLMGQPELFAIEETAEGFARAVEAAAATRLDPVRLQHRREQARKNSYDARFEGVVSAIQDFAARRRSEPKRLNVCVLYDRKSLHVNTMREHLDAFRRYSRHHVYYLPATEPDLPGFAVAPLASGADAAAPAGWVAEPDFSLFDVVVVHYGVRVCFEEHMAAAVERALVRYRGHKVLFLQDEYDHPEVTRRWMERVGVDTVYTCLPPDAVHAVYPPERFERVRFVQTLTGYVPDDAVIECFARPLRERSTLIGYRGRRLAPIYGELGWEKARIGREVRRLAQERGLPVDIEIDEDKRIYGKAWYQFLGSARATLATESGCNLFDFDGSAARLIRAHEARHPGADYESLRAQLAPYEGAIRTNQVSPRIFEAIRTRTALVLFEGDYSGVVRPHDHYIPLKRDCSNFDEVVRTLQDDAAVQALTDRAYRDIVEAGRYSYRGFVQGVDADLEHGLLRGPRVRLCAVPLLALAAGGRVEAVGPEAAAALLSQQVMDDDAASAWLQALGARMAAAQASVVTGSDGVPGGHPASGRGPVRELMGKGWRMLPRPLRTRAAGVVFGAVQRYRRDEVQKTRLDRLLSALWRRMPHGAKRVARRIIYGAR